MMINSRLTKGGVLAAVLMLGAASADAAPICKDGRTYYGASELASDRQRAEGIALRAWRQARTHATDITSERSRTARLHCETPSDGKQWRCFVVAGPCMAS